MIALLIYLMCVVFMAYLEADTDARAIAESKSINHRDELIERAVMCACVGLFLCAAFRMWEWRTLLWIPAAWAAFTIAFRWVLNRMRGKDWRYVSPSNWYDWQWLKIAGNGLTRLDWFRAVFTSTMRPSDEWAYRAGLYAYAFESAVLIASLITYMIL